MTLEKLIELARERQTPEQKLEYLLARKKALAELEEESRRNGTCSECGVDTRHYSHTFRCYWRGLC